MTHIFTTTTENIEAISYGDSYLYQQYEKIRMFLTLNYSGKYKDILAKPVLLKGENKIDWYGEFDAPLSKLYDLSLETQTAFKIQYWDTLHILHEDVEKLQKSTNKQSREWGTMLKEVFNDDNNIILSDGTNWCLLWGWRFRTREDNYLPPEFLNPVETKPIEQDPGQTINIGPTNPPIDPPISPPIIIPDPNDIDEKPVDKSSKNKFNFWYWLKRSLRNFVYRFWGLMLLIVLILLIICLTKKCSNDSCCDDKVMQEQLDSLEKIANEHCSNQ